MLPQDLRIVFHGLDRSQALEAAIREEAEKLERIHDRILGGTATVEAVHRHGQHHCVGLHLRLLLPGKREIVVREEPGDSAHRDDPYGVVRAAFAVARRRLMDSVTQRRNRVKWGAGDSPLAADVPGPDVPR
ncbi:MAG: HPF/RaiA family ribosome-associated protein [Rhodothalassiaceae bacterium]